MPGFRFECESAIISSRKLNYMRAQQSNTTREITDRDESCYSMNEFGFSVHDSFGLFWVSHRDGETICRTRPNYRVDDLMAASSLSSLLSVVIILGEPLMYSVSCWKIVPSSV